MKRKGIILVIAGVLLAAVVVIAVLLVLCQQPVDLTAENYKITVDGDFELVEDSEYSLEAYQSDKIGLIVGCYETEFLKSKYGESETADAYLEAMLKADGAYDIEYGETESGKLYAAYRWDDEDGGVYFFISGMEKDPVKDVYWFTDMHCADENRSEYEETLLGYLDSVTLE